MPTDDRSASTGLAARSAVRRPIVRYPLVSAVVVTVAFGSALLCWPLAFPIAQLRVRTAGWALAGLDATRVLVPVVLLSLLGWWHTARFTRRPNVASLRPFLPLLLLPVRRCCSGCSTCSTCSEEIVP